MRRKEGMDCKKNIYTCISRDPLIIASSVFRRLSFRLPPLYPLDRAVCSLPRNPLSLNSPFSFSPSLTLSILQPELSPAASFSSFNWFLKARWRSQMWFERMQFYPPASYPSLPFDPRLCRDHHHHLNIVGQSFRIFFFLLSRIMTTTTTRRTK